MAQGNLKRLIRHASVNHVGYVILGLAAAGAAVAGKEAAQAIALTGATVEMVAHGLITGSMFLISGSVLARAHTYEIDEWRDDPDPELLVHASGKARRRAQEFHIAPAARACGFDGAQETIHDGRQPTRRRHTRPRNLFAAVFAVVMALVPARTAFADGGEEDFTAADFVEQAIGLLQGQPEQNELIEDRIGDALEDDEVEGVDLVLVAQAREVFEEGRVSETLELLARSIGEEVGPALHQPEVGGGIETPTGAAGPALLALAAVLIAAGAFVTAKVR